MEAPPRIADPWSPRALALATLAVALLAVLGHALALRSGFVSDDHTLILNSELVREPGAWGAVLTTDFFRNPDRALLHRPLVVATFKAQWAMHGGEALPFHAANLLLHALNAALLGWVLRLYLGREPLAWLAAGLWAIHPLQTEAVGLIFARTELLAATGQLIALLAWLRGRGRRWPIGWALLAVAGLLVGLLSKESAVCLPGIVVAEGVIRRRPWREVLGWVALMSAVIAGWLLWRWSLFGVVAANPQRPEVFALINPAADLPPVRRVMQGFFLTAFAAWKFVWPASLSLDYSSNQISSEPTLLWCAGVVMGVMMLARPLIGLVRSWPGATLSEPSLLAAGWFWPTWILVSNIVAPGSTIFAERLLYFPSVGFAIAAAWFLVSLGGWLRPRGQLWLGLLALGALGLLCMSRAWRHHADFRTNETALLAAAEASPNSAMALTNAASIHIEMAKRAPTGSTEWQAHLQEAERLIERAIPNYDLHIGLWLARADVRLMLHRDVEGAIADLQRAHMNTQEGDESREMIRGLLAELGAGQP